jgi:hypothetical protein
MIASYLVALHLGKPKKMKARRTRACHEQPRGVSPLSRKILGFPVRRRKSILAGTMRLKLGFSGGVARRCVFTPFISVMLWVGIWRVALPPARSVCLV